MTQPRCHSSQGARGRGAPAAGGARGAPPAAVLPLRCSPSCGPTHRAPDFVDLSVILLWTRRAGRRQRRKRGVRLTDQRRTGRGLSAAHGGPGERRGRGRAAAGGAPSARGADARGRAARALGAVRQHQARPLPVSGGSFLVAPVFMSNDIVPVSATFGDSLVPEQGWSQRQCPRPSCACACNRVSTRLLMQHEVGEGERRGHTASCKKGGGVVVPSGTWCMIRKQVECLVDRQQRMSSGCRPSAL